MLNCLTKIESAVKVMKDRDAQQAASLRLPCASMLFSMKTSRQNAKSGTLCLLMNARLFDAADRRDKVFALVGLTSDIDKSFVDYSKSYEDVTRDLNSMLLEGRIEPTTGSVLDVWSLITREENDEIAEPSWVVDILKPRNSKSTNASVMTFYPSREPHIVRKTELQFSGEHGKKVSFT